MLSHLTLVRDYRDARCTLGKFTAGILVLDTLERPWVPSDLNLCGTKGVSCVPAGDYQLVPHNSDAHLNVWALVNPKLGVYHWDADVPPSCALARTTVLIHAANFPEELRGCIAVGKLRSKTRGAWWIGRSRDALADLRFALVARDDLTLSISEAESCSPSSNPPVKGV